MPWYIFTPVLPSNDPEEPNNWTLIGSPSTPCPKLDSFLCAIKADDNMGKPVITEALSAEIVTAINNKAETTNVLVRYIVK